MAPNDFIKIFLCTAPGLGAFILVLIGKEEAAFLALMFWIFTVLAYAVTGGLERD
ncbi:MAG: hypothetical protein KAS32_27225 [Candidatus Peribacteraceae bacterium]|nr:hypothetical protein [Candidatus Peribacteraceae bacterium]